MAKQRLTEIKVGIFLLVSLVVAATLVIRFGKYAQGLQKTYRITVVFPNVGGIVRDANVLYAGIPVGKVRDITLREDDTLKVDVALAINQGVVLRKNASFVINQSGLLGDKYIDVVPGSTKAEPLKPGDVVQGTTSVDLSEAIRGVVDVLKQAAGMMARVDSAIRRIDETVLSRPSLDHVSSALANIDVASSNTVELTLSIRGVIDDNRSRVSDTLQRVSEASESFRSSARRADALVAKADGFVGRADGFVARVDSMVATNQNDIHLAIQNLEQSAQRLNTVLERLERGQGTVGKLLVDPSLHDELLHLVENWRRYGLLYKEGRPAHADDGSRGGKGPVPARPAAKAGQELNFGTDLTAPGR